MNNNNWQVKSLGDIFDIFPGGTPSRNIAEYWGGDIPWVKISDMLQSTIAYTEENISEVGLANSSAKIIPKGSLLISIFATVGRTAFLDIDATTNQAIVGLVAKEQNLDLNFVRYYLDFKVDKMKELSRGVAQNNINKSILSAVKVPLPPFQIQKQIAEILEQSDKAKQKRKEANKLTDEFLQSVFIEMFGDPVMNPKGWGEVNLASIGEWQSGGTPSRAIKKYFQGEIPWYSSGELNSMYLTDSDECITEEAVNESNAKIIEPNTILVGMYDTAAFKLGITTKYCSCNQAIAYSKLNALKVNTIFLYYLMQIGRAFFISGQRGVRQKNLNLTMIRETKIALPPLPLQQQFAEIVNKTEALKEKQKQSEQELENLFQSLMQKAFKGELV